MSDEIKLGIAGFGTIGQKVARYIEDGLVDRVKLVAVSASNLERARERAATLSSKPVVVSSGELADHADVIVECSPAAAFAEVAGPAVAKGRCFMPLSVGAFLKHLHLVDEARRTGAQIIVPTGALIGLDTVRAMAIGEIHSVTLETRKPPNGLSGAPYLVENNIDVDNLSEALLVFEGNAGEAAEAFPANVNVAAALALAGVGPERTRIKVWADPDVGRNRQTITIEADTGEATMTINNLPSIENPKTGRIVANSVIAALQRMTAPLVAGT